MNEVAQNLLENALKFTGNSDAPEIRVKAGLEDGQAVCRVEDNGTGAETQYQEQIFGLFNRLSQSYEGTGIGLALAKPVIEVWRQSLGRIERSGAGRQFLFYPSRLAAGRPG